MQSTQGYAAILTLPFAIATWPSQPVPAASWASAVMLGVVCTGAAFVMYYRLIARIGASRASTVTYLIPVFGVAWAWLLLDEPLTLTMAILTSGGFEGLKVYAGDLTYLKVTGRKPAPVVMFARMRERSQHMAQGVWRTDRAHPRGADVVDVQAREIDDAPAGPRQP